MARGTKKLSTGRGRNVLKHLQPKDQRVSAGGLGPPTTGTDPELLAPRELRWAAPALGSGHTTGWSESRHFLGIRAWVFPQPLTANPFFFFFFLVKNKQKCRCSLETSSFCSAFPWECLRLSHSLTPPHKPPAGLKPTPAHSPTSHINKHLLLPRITSRGEASHGLEPFKTGQQTMHTCTRTHTCTGPTSLPTTSGPGKGGCVKETTCVQRVGSLGP